MEMSCDSKEIDHIIERMFQAVKAVFKIEHQLNTKPQV